MDIHSFYEICTDRFGFDDGDEIPIGAYDVRERLLLEINAILDREGKTEQVIVYDRPGLHNSCMMQWIDEKVPENIDDILEEINTRLTIAISMKIDEEEL